MKILKAQSQEILDLYGYSGYQEFINDPDFQYFVNSDNDISSAFNSFNTACLAPDWEGNPKRLRALALIQKFRPKAKEILDSRAKVFAQVAGLSDWRMGYLTSQYYLLLAIFKDESGKTCGYRLYDELTDTFDDYTAESVIDCLRNHTVKIHNMFWIDDNIYISGGESAYTQLNPDGSLVDTDYIKLGKKNGEVVTKSSERVKRTPLVFFRYIKQDFAVYLDYEAQAFYGEVRDGFVYTYSDLLRATNVATYTLAAYSTLSYLVGSKGVANNRIMLHSNTGEDTILPEEMGTGYAVENIPYYLGLSSKNNILTRHCHLNIYNGEENSKIAETMVKPADFITLDVSYNVELRIFNQDILTQTYGGARFCYIAPRNMRDEVFQSSYSTLDKTFKSVNTTAIAHFGTRFYPEMGFAVLDTISTGTRSNPEYFEDLSDNYLFRNSTTEYNLEKEIVAAYPDEIQAQARVITSLMPYASAVEYFPYSVPTRFLKMQEEFNKQVSLVAVTGKYTIKSNNYGVTIKLNENAVPDSFLDLIPDGLSYTFRGFQSFTETNYIDTLQVRGSCCELTGTIPVKNIVLAPNSRYFSLVSTLSGTAPNLKVTIAGIAEELAFIVLQDTMRSLDIDIIAPIKRIAPRAFRLDNNLLNTVSLPETLEVLGAYALANSASLQYAELKGCLEIGEHAFEEDKALRRVEFPPNLKKIYPRAFSYCSSLTQVELTSCEVIDSEAFFGCKSLVRLVLPDNLVEIGASAFSGCINLTEVIIPASCKIISREAFKECVALTKLIFAGSPSTIQIDKEAFSSCPYDIQKQIEPYICRSRKRK